MGGFKGLVEAAKGLSGIVQELRRIANALEYGVRPSSEGFRSSWPDSEGDGSFVGWVDDTESALLEERQEVYFRRTGRRLSPGEEPPAPPGAILPYVGE